MATSEAQPIYRRRAGTAERVNAEGRTHRTLNALAVRGFREVHTWVLWVALAHNLLRAMEMVPHQMMQTGRRGDRLPIASTARAA